VFDAGDIRHLKTFGICKKDIGIAGPDTGKCLLPKPEIS